MAGNSLMVGQWALLAINRVDAGARCSPSSLPGSDAAGRGHRGCPGDRLGWLLLGGSPRIGAVLPSVLIAFAPYWLGSSSCCPHRAGWHAS